MTATNSIKRVSYKWYYRHGVDEKRRVQIPAKWRSAEDSSYTVTFWEANGADCPCLLVMPMRTFERLEAQLEVMPFGDPMSESLRRILGTASDEVSVDRAGRICLPDELAKVARLNGDAMLVGCLDRFQIWNPDVYEKVKSLDLAHKSAAIKMI